MGLQRAVDGLPALRLAGCSASSRDCSRPAIFRVPQRLPQCPLRPARALSDRRPFRGIAGAKPATPTAHANRDGFGMDRSGERVARRGRLDYLVTNAECARAQIPDAPLPSPSRGGRLQAGGVKPLSLLPFFAAAKKGSAAPHRGNANRPQRFQGKAKAPSKQPKKPPHRQPHQPCCRI